MLTERRITTIWVILLHTLKIAVGTQPWYFSRNLQKECWTTTFKRCKGWLTVQKPNLITMVTQWMAIVVIHKLYVEPKAEESNHHTLIRTVVRFTKRDFSCSVARTQKFKQIYSHSRIVGRLIRVRISRAKKTFQKRESPNLISKLTREPLSSSRDWTGIEQQKTRTRVEVFLTVTIATTKITHHHTDLLPQQSFWITRWCPNSCQSPTYEVVTAILINSGFSQSTWRTRFRVQSPSLAVHTIY